MKVALVGDDVYIADMDGIQYKEITSWGLTRWSKAKQALVGPANIDLLQRLRGMTGRKLTRPLEERLARLVAVQAAVDKERLNPEPVPFIEPPVNAKLYAHQIRGYNMALLTLGLVKPEGGDLIASTQTSTE